MGWRYCPHCGSALTHEASHAKCPYRCTDCRSYFSAKTGTVIEGSKISFRKWVFVIYLECTSLKSISSMKLHREIKVSQKTAWFMLHRIRKVWRTDKNDRLPGPVEIDETYIGGKCKNMHGDVRRQEHHMGKTIVIGSRDRATGRVHGEAIPDTTGATLSAYVAEFAGRHNMRELGTANRMASVVAGLVGKRLIYRELTA